MIRPLVTVIVPMFNSERHVRETLDSIAAQTLRNLEVIVVDDGSTDDSIAIVEEFVAHDDRFRLETEAPQGSAGAARNVGLGLAQGAYLAFLDADDLFEPTMLQKLYAKGRAEDADIVMTAFRSFSDATGRREPLGRRGRLHAHLLPKTTPFGPEDISDHIFTAPHTTVWNKVFKTEFIRRIGLEFEPVRRSNDAYFNMMALAQAGRLTYVNEPLVNYRASNENSLQGSQSDVDFSWADASRAVAHDLRMLGLYDGFRRAMIQRVATRSFDRLSKATTPESYAEVYETVRYTLFPEFEVDTAAVSDFPDPTVGPKVDEFLRLPMTEWLHTHPSLMSRATPETMRSETNTIEAAAWVPRTVAPGPEGPVALNVDVSVVIPITAGSPHLDTCIRSVLGQSAVNVEVILVTDSLAASLANMDKGLRQDPRIQIITEPRADEAGARNAGVAGASGRYIIHLDADDYWAADFLGSAVHLAEERRANLVELVAFSVLDGVARTDSGLSDPGGIHAQASLSTTASLLARFRRTRHLRDRVGVLLVRRDHLRDIDMHFAPGVSTDVYTLNLLLRTDHVLTVPGAVYAHRVRTTASDARDDIETSVASLRRHVALRHVLRNTRVPEDAAADADAILEESLTQATGDYASLSRRSRAAVRAADRSGDARAARQEMERALQRETQRV